MLQLVKPYPTFPPAASRICLLLRYSGVAVNESHAQEMHACPRIWRLSTMRIKVGALIVISLMLSVIILLGVGTYWIIKVNLYRARFMNHNDNYFYNYAINRLHEYMATP